MPYVLIGTKVSRGVFPLALHEQACPTSRVAGHRLVDAGLIQVGASPPTFFEKTSILSKQILKDKMEGFRKKKRGTCDHLNMVTFAKGRVPPYFYPCKTSGDFRVVLLFRPCTLF